MNTDEVTRYRQFRPFRSEIRLSGDYLIVEIDISKDKHHTFFWIVERRDVPSSCDL